jgi:hypothetical protein
MNSPPAGGLDKVETRHAFSLAAAPISTNALVDGADTIVETTITRARWSAVHPAGDRKQNTLTPRGPAPLSSLQQQRARHTHTALVIAPSHRNHLVSPLSDRKLCR